MLSVWGSVSLASVASAVQTLTATLAPMGNPAGARAPVSLMRASFGLALLGAFLLSACAADGSGSPSGTVRVGEALDLEDPDRAAVATTTTSRDHVSAQAEPTDTAAPEDGASDARVANRTVRDDPSGLRLTLVVADRLTFSTSDFIQLELGFENVSSDALFHDSNQRRVFVIAPAPQASGRFGWSDDSCRSEGTTEPPLTGPLELGPGESGAFQATYPARQTTRDAGYDIDQCRLDPGAYHVSGKVDWCPQASLRDTNSSGKFYCDPDEVVEVWATPLRITIE